MTGVLSDKQNNKVVEALTDVCVPPGRVVTKWVAVVETVNLATGAHGIRLVASPDILGWDALGLLTAVQATVHHDYCTWDDDDEDT